jgi:FMN phosphatase YigB (HAD superfamily)
LSTTGVKHLLLDLDGTLLASSRRGLRIDFIRGCLGYLRRRGIPAWKAIKAIHLMRKAIEKPGTALTNEQRAGLAFARALGIEEGEARSLMHGMVSEVFPALRKHFHEIPGARDFVAWAGERFPITLATNPVWPREIVLLRLSWAGIDPSAFGFITHAAEMRACKPCVEYYEELLERLGLDPATALMVGDSERKDLPACKAGVPVFLLEAGSTAPELISLRSGVWSGGFAPLKGLLERERTIHS